MSSYLKSFASFLLIICFTFSSSVTFSCASFQLQADNKSFHGKSYDWDFGDGLIIYNPRYLSKRSLSFNPENPELNWISSYASLTFNQYGLDFPNSGFNHAGLSVEILWLDKSVFPPQDQRQTLNELQWIQYILDTKSTIAQVIQSLDTIRIEPVYAKVHYFVCDISQECITVEFIKGKAVVGKYDSIGYSAITNSTHAESVSYLRRFKNFGGNKSIKWKGYDSKDRYVRLNELLRVYNSQNPVEYAFKMLDAVKKANYTQWQIVHDKENLKSYFKTQFGNMEMAEVSLNSFPFACTYRYYFDLENQVRGDIRSAFLPLNPETNYQHVKKTLLKVMPHAPEEMIQAIAMTPFHFPCMQAQ